MFRMEEKLMSGPEMGEKTNDAFTGVVMMSCSVRKNGPKCWSK